MTGHDPHKRDLVAFKWDGRTSDEIFVPMGGIGVLKWEPPEHAIENNTLVNDCSGADWLARL